MLRVSAWKLSLYLILIFPGFQFLTSQPYDTLNLLEESLEVKYDEILNTDLFSRSEKADSFYIIFAGVLEVQNSFEYPFSHLKNIGIIYSPDKRIKIYTWNIPVGYDDNLYFGMIQYYSNLHNTWMVVRLNDSVNLGMQKIRSRWNEALYYSIVETRHAGQDYYTLLGFNFNNPLSNYKSIDIISIDSFDELYFCQDLFFYQQEKTNRIVFEYNEKAVMSLQYSKDMKMIVFDHLSPAKPSYEGNYEFYGPDFTYDGLKWQKGVWVLYSNIEVTN